MGPLLSGSAGPVLYNPYANPYVAAPYGLERHVIPEVSHVPVQQTVMVPQLGYQSRTIKVPVPRTVQIPRTVRPRLMLRTLHAGYSYSLVLKYVLAMVNSFRGAGHGYPRCDRL